MGVGIIARDHEGRVLKSKCMQRPRITDPAVAEAFAAWAAVDFGIQMGFSSINLEGDLLEVVKAFHREE